MSSDSGVWGPRGGPPAYLYRAIRADLQDVTADYVRRNSDIMYIMYLSSDVSEMRRHVLRSLLEGGFHASPLLRFTKSLACAQTWGGLARSEQNEMDCGQLIVRLDMTRFSEHCSSRHTTVEAKVIDLSDEAAQDNFLVSGQRRAPEPA